MTRTAWIVLAATLASMAIGCGDDDGVTPMDGGMDGSSTGPTCPPMAPEPHDQIGACCSRAVNDARLDNPELRLSGIRVLSPSTLANTIIRGLLSGALDEERFNWLIRLEGAPTSGMGPVSIKTGLGFRGMDGTFAYAMGNAPGPGPVDRWDPKTFMGTMDGEMFTAPRATETVTIPIFNDPDDAGVTTVLLELPIFGLQLASATLSENRSCVGVRNPASYDTSMAHLSGFLKVEDTLDGQIHLSASLTASLCMIIAGMSSMPGNCRDMDMAGMPLYPQSGWMQKPDSLCGTSCVSNTETPGTCDPDTTCNAWELSADFAAQGVEISN